MKHNADPGEIGRDAIIMLIQHGDRYVEVEVEDFQWSLTCRTSSDLCVR